MPNIILSQITLDELLGQIKVIIEATVREETANKSDEKLISPREACKLFEPSISLPTLSAWTKSGQLISSRMGSRVFYNKKQILEAGKQLKRYRKISSDGSTHGSRSHTYAYEENCTTAASKLL